MKTLCLFCLFCIAVSTTQAQTTRYIVQLKNKAGTPYSISNPAAYLSSAAINRRFKYNIAIDSTDLPVNPMYIAEILGFKNVQLLNVSKWLNQVSIQTSNPAAITSISALPFVSGVINAASGAQTLSVTQSKNQDNIDSVNTNVTQGNLIAGNYYDYGLAYPQIKIHNGEFLHNIGLRGQTMTIAVIDEGFKGYTTLEAFDSLNINGQVLSTWDFVSRNANVLDDSQQGMRNFSTIAANIPGVFVGNAPSAKFHLYRTEDEFSEYLIEEHLWACGAERADSSGADIITSSVGYTEFQNPAQNHTYAQLDGNTTMIAKAADLAAKKGILVFQIMGNEGNSAWHFMFTPADADSIIAVGSVNVQGNVSVTSGYGPSSDGQVKPDVAAVGVGAIIQDLGGLAVANGTAYAGPKMAGLATCLWQGFPEFNNIKIINALRAAGNRSGNPDNRTGYGIPDVRLAFKNLLADYAEMEADFTHPCIITVAWNSKDVSGMLYEVERKLPGETNYTRIKGVQGSGALLTNHTYQVNDTLAGITTQGKMSYRIRQIIDTSVSNFTDVYIDTFSFDYNWTSCLTANNIRTQTVKEDKNIFSISPNPVSDNLTILFNQSITSQNISLFIYDMRTGVMRMEIKEPALNGGKRLMIPVFTLPNGLYIIKAIKNGEEISSKQFIKN
jgi:hypothetical protein